MRLYATMNLEVYAVLESDDAEPRFKELAKAVQAAGWTVGRAANFELRGEYEVKE